MHAQAPADDAAQQQHLVTVLTTEIYILQMARSNTVQESMARITTFLTSLSGGLVALGFVAQSTRLEGSFHVFAESILVTVAFIGAATFWRVLQTSLDDMALARGMGRIRGALLEMVPHAGASFTQPTTDDQDAALVQYGGGGWFQLFANGAGMVGIVTGAVVAALAAVVAMQFGWGRETALAAAAAVLAAAGYLQAKIQVRQYAAGSRAYERVSASRPAAPSGHR